MEKIVVLKGLSIFASKTFQSRHCSLCPLAKKFSWAPSSFAILFWAHGPQFWGEALFPISSLMMFSIFFASVRIELIASEPFVCIREVCTVCRITYTSMRIHFGPFCLVCLTLGSSAAAENCQIVICKAPTLLLRDVFVPNFSPNTLGPEGKKNGRRREKSPQFFDPAFPLASEYGLRPS